MRPGLLLVFLFLQIYLAKAQEIDSLKRPEIYPEMVAMHAKFSQSSRDIVFLGNSITFWANWPELLPKYKDVKNRGIPGDNTFGVLERLDQILKGKPRKIFLLIGINDLAQGIPETVILKNVERICQRVRGLSPHTKLVIQSVLPVNSTFGKLNNHYGAKAKIPILNAALKSLAASNQHDYLDLYAAFVGDQHELPKAYTWDGVHLTAAGYELWVRILEQQKLLIN